jgi:glycosyltransferase involved in cell wall biosynthesis
VVTVSDYNEQFLRGNFGAAADHVLRIYNGLDLAEFPFRSPMDRPPRIVAVGRLIEKKGFADLISACALLREAGIPFTCQIIGSGEQDAMLRREIVANGLEDRVEMVGALPLAEVKARVQDASLLAVPCVVGGDGNRDGLPTVLLEAMALGTPCAATDVTGIPELVWNEETGLLVPSRDVRELAGALGRLLSDPSLRVRLARQARSLIEREFDIHRNSSLLRELFRAAVEANRVCGTVAVV